MMRAIAGTAGLGLFNPGPVLARFIEQSNQPCGDDRAPGKLIGTLPLSRPGGLVQPFGVKIGGQGLDARLNTDLSRLESDRMITPNELAYVRTECPAPVSAYRGPWRVRTSGQGAQTGALGLDDLA